MKKNRKQTYLLLGILLLVLASLAGCGTGSTNTKESEKVRGEIEDVVTIPEDGIITQEQFEAFAGTDRIVTFQGEADGISYAWQFSGRNIQNPQDMNLQIDFVTGDEDLADIKKLSGEAPYAIGLAFKAEELITVPTLTIELPEKWDADTAVYCFAENKKAMKLSDASIGNVQGEEAEHTALSVNVTEVGRTYYIVAGNAQGASGAGNAAGTAAGTAGTQNGGSGSASQTTQSRGHSVTIAIYCGDILQHMDRLKSGKAEFVPSDGVILATTTVKYQEGDSVFDILLAVCQDNSIHMEHSYFPGYGSEYIEGIHQLYEFDCGPLSGWKYSVNGWYPNYGCDKYLVSDGDIIQWNYICE